MQTVNGKLNIMLLQFSDNLLTSDPSSRDYYRKSYAMMPGYAFPEHFYEIPYWIPMVSSLLPTSQFDVQFHVCENTESFLNEPLGFWDECTVITSVMDANLAQVLELAKGGVNLLLGGYVSPAAFSDFPNVTFFNDMYAFAKYMGVETPAGHIIPDYRFFKGMRCIPRLTLSTGCSFRCHFCTDIPLKVQPLEEEEIMASVRALRPLDFDLVYIDDKSFGQSKNWQLLGRIREEIRESRSDFCGFIVQTPPSISCREGFLELCKKLGVKYLEAGVESVNDEILSQLNKPFRKSHLDRTVQLCRELGIKLIPNLIIGLPGDNYQSTIDWVSDNVDVIPVVNFNYFAVHDNSVRGSLPVTAISIGDKDQNTPHKSWLSKVDVMRGEEAIRRIRKVTFDALTVHAKSVSPT